MRNPHRKAFWALSALVAIGIAGCSDSTGVEEEFDPVTANAAAEDVQEALASNPALASLGVLGAYFPDFAAAPLAATVPSEYPTADESGHWLDQRRQALSAWTRYDSPDGPAAVTFPADLLGKTLVFNPATEQYEVDDTRDDPVPANGIWLVLYAVDPILHQIVEPLTEVGYLELTDEDTPSMDALGIKAVINEVTVLEYLASAVVTTQSITFSADGYAFNGQTRANFELSASFSETSGVSIDYFIEVPEEASIHLQLDVTQGPETASMRLEITHGPNTAVMELDVSDTVFEGGITHNGDLVIEISGTPEEPVFTNVATGEPLTEAQLFALAHILEAAGEVLETFDDLLGPAVAVLQVPVYAF